MVKRAVLGGGGDLDLGVLLDAIGFKKFAGEIDDGVASPSHDEASGIGDGGDVDTLEVFFMRFCDEVVEIGGVDADGHAFLGFRDGDFGAIEAFVFFRDFIEIEDEAVGDFPDCDGDAPGSEVVTDFNFGREFWVAEKSLDLALGGSVAFLDFGGIFECGFGVLFGGAGSTAYAIAPGASSDEEDEVICVRAAAEDILARGG